MKPLTNEELDALQRTKNIVFAQKVKTNEIIDTSEHVQEVMNINGEEVLIDKPLLKIISWFNKLKDVKTLFCCQEKYDENITQCEEFTFFNNNNLQDEFTRSPYVLFTCDSMETFNKITEISHLFRATIEASYYNNENRFLIQWPYKLYFELFLRYIDREW